MKPIPNFTQIPSRSHRGRLAAGGYVIKITEVSDNPSKEYLTIIYDIAEGPEAGRFADEFFKDKPYAHRVIRSYKETAQGMLKEFTEAVDASNGTAFTEQVEKGLDETKLVGKLVGLVLGEEEYETERGETKMRLYADSFMDIKAIRAGEFRVPEPKRLARPDMKPAPEISFGEAVDGDDGLPF